MRLRLGLRLITADCRLEIGDCKLETGDCRLGYLSKILADFKGKAIFLWQPQNIYKKVTSIKSDCIKGKDEQGS